MRDTTKDYEKYNSLYEAFEETMIKMGDAPVITDKYTNSHFTYSELKEQVDCFASALQDLGVKKGDIVSIFSENHGKWLIPNLAVMKCGGVSSIRGSNTTLDELKYIIELSDSKGIILRDSKLLNNLLPLLSDLNLDFIIVIFKTEDFPTFKTPIYSYEEIVARGKDKTFVDPQIQREDSISMLYTSGTTGYPKAVVLTHSNSLSQLPSFIDIFGCEAGDNTLQILPIWHAYELSGTYAYLRSGSHMHFTNLANIKKDLEAYPIDRFMSVPRIWEAFRIGIYQKLKQKSKLMHAIFDFAIKTSIAYKTHRMYGERRITNKMGYHVISTIRHRIIRSFIKPLHVLFSLTLYKKLKAAAGLNFKVSASGGGALSMQDELFYDAIGVKLIVGYGLTETSPLVTARTFDGKNFLGCAGTPTVNTEVKIVNPSTFEELPRFSKGLVMVRGPQVMKGYYKNEEATKAVITEDGWFNTGDLGWLTFQNNLVLVGRLKETIVLSNGENVEPIPIEEACLLSPYIEQIVLVGQDRSGIGALIVPSKEALEKCGLKLTDMASYTEAIDNEELEKLISKEINSNIKNKANLKIFEKIKQFSILKEAFSVENGLLSATAKIKRNKVFEKYQDLITQMYKKFEKK